MADKLSNHLPLRDSMKHENGAGSVGDRPEQGATADKLSSYIPRRGNNAGLHSGVEAHKESIGHGRKPQMTHVIQRGMPFIALVLLGATLLLPLSRRTPPSRAHSPGLIVYASNRVAEQYELFVIRDDGTDDRRLTTHLFADEIAPDWAPDGSRIAFVSNRFGPADLFIMNSDGTNQQRLIINTLRREFDPDWSPDGTQIAFAWDWQGGQFDIWVADLSTSVVLLRQITNDPGDERQPAWSPDGRHIAYTCQWDDQDEICSVDLITLEVRRLTHRPLTDERQPAWSPDGASILFTSFGATAPVEEGAPTSPADWELSKLATPTATTTATATVTLPPTSSATPTTTATSSVTPTPTETETATPTATPTPTLFERAAIWIMDADGSNPRVLIDLGDRVFDPAWAPDGTRIAFTRQTFDLQAHRLNPPRLYIYDIASGSITPLGPHQSAVLGQAPDWIAVPESPPQTPTSTPTATVTSTPSPSATLAPPLTPTPTANGGSPTAVPTPTQTATLSLSPSPSPTVTPTPSLSPPPPTATPTATPTAGVPSPPGATCQVVRNPGFETGPPAAPWVLDRHGAGGTLIVQAARRSGQWGLRLGSQDNAWDDARQVVTLRCPELGPLDDRSRIVATFSFWWRAVHEGPATNGDVLNAVLLTADGRQLLQLLATITDQDADGTWRRTATVLKGHIGETVQLAIAATTDEQDPTTFDVDDIALTLEVVRSPHRRFLPFVRR